MAVDLLVNIETNLFAIENILVLIFLMGGLIFYAVDYKIGVLANMLISSGMFILFYEWGWNYRLPLILSLGYFVLLCISLFFMNKTEKAQGFIS